MTGWLGKRRPISTLELGQAFFVIERNYIGMLLLMGLIQVVTDNEVKAYLIRGKKLSENQIDTFNNVLKEEGFLGTITVAMEVGTSTVSPFSEKLIMYTIDASNASGLSTLAYGAALSMRRDLAAHYAKSMANVAAYAEDGMELMTRRGWFEAPPLAPHKR